MNALFQQALSFYRFTAGEQAEFLKYLNMIGEDPADDTMDAGEVEDIINSFFRYKFSAASE